VTSLSSAGVRPRAGVTDTTDRCFATTTALAVRPSVRLVYIPLAAAAAAAAAAASSLVAAIHCPQYRIDPPPHSCLSPIKRILFLSQLIVQVISASSLATARHLADLDLSWWHTNSNSTASEPDNCRQSPTRVSCCRVFSATSFLIWTERCISYEKLGARKTAPVFWCKFPNLV